MHYPLSHGDTASDTRGYVKRLTQGNGMAAVTGCAYRQRSRVYTFGGQDCPEPVRQARWVAVSALTTWGLANLVADAQTVVDELAANAVEHAGGLREVSLKYEVETGVVRLEVTDKGLGRGPVLRPPEDAWSEGGRGLMLVEAMTARWGVHRSNRWHRVVYAEWHLEPSPENSGHPSR